MRYGPLGDSGISVSVVGLGTWAMGGDEWGPSDDTESVRVIRRTLELGISLIDTADVYGAGHSEDLVAQALRGREDVVIVSKAGWDIYSSPGAAGADLGFDPTALQSLHT